MAWERVSAAEMLSYQGNPKDLLGTGSAIYLWKRHFRPAQQDLADSQKFMSWLQRVIGAPVAYLEKVRVAHFLTFSGVALSGELTEDKLLFLSSQAKTMEGRKRLAAFLHGLADQTPALYVGETDEISKRPYSHMSGETDFGMAIDKSTTTSWFDLDLHFLRLDFTNTESEVAKKYRTALEQIAANVTIAGLTRRAG